VTNGFFSPDRSAEIDNYICSERPREKEKEKNGAEKKQSACINKVAMIFSLVLTISYSK
jgi:hypothetical protein